MRAWCPLVLLLGAACLVAASAADEIVFPQPPRRRVRPNRRPATVKVVPDSTTPCTGCGSVPALSNRAESTLPESYQYFQEPAIPLDLLRKLNEIDDLDELFSPPNELGSGALANLTDLYGVDPGQNIARNQRAHSDPLTVRVSSDASTSDEVDNPDNPIAYSSNPVVSRSSNGERPRFARCQEPELVTVSLVPEGIAENPFEIYHPSCTRLRRCGGCCNSDLLSCQPTNITLRTFKVSVLSAINGQFSRTGKNKTVHIEEHQKCACMCKIKAEHCNSLQQYDENACRCRCINIDDKIKCDAETRVKFWDYETCLCKCRQESECSTGFYFDQLSCSCKSDTIVYSKYQSVPRQQGSSYQYQPTPWEQVTGLKSKRNP